MSTSLLYHAFGVRGDRYQRTDYAEGRVIMTVTQPRETLRCPACGSADVHRRGEKWRSFRGLPIGSKATAVVLGVPRVSCERCGVVRQVNIAFADPRKSYTRSFGRYVLELSGKMTIQDVADHLGVGWDLVKEIQKDHLKKHFAEPKLRHVRQIAIDEISIGKGHRYLTVVLDLESGAVIHVGPGKGADALKPFWKRLKASRAKIEAVALDMSPAYIAAVIKNLPGVPLVFDRFHIMKLFNEKLSTLRRELYREAADGLQKDVLKGIRWLLLKNSENLDDSKNERQRLDDALDLNRSLATAYYLQELLRWFWQQPTKGDAAVWLDEWCGLARASGIRVLQTFANTLQGHRSGLLASWDHPISTGPLEGTNNKIKTMQRQAYGYRDREFFELKIFAIHQARYELVG
jgi:transposase